MNHFFKKKSPRKKSAFTLLEVMIATAILSLGAVLVHQAFFLLLDAYSYCNNYLNLNSWAEEKVWEAQDNLRRFGSLAYVDTGGVFQRDYREFDWSLSYSLIDQGLALDLYEINFILTWQQGNRQVKILRSAYAMHRLPK